MFSCCNFFIFEAKSLICSLVGAFLSTLTRHSLVLVPSLFQSSADVNLHFPCPNSASVLSSCYSWYLLTWNCLQLEFCDNDQFKALVNMTTVLVSLNTAFCQYLSHVSSNVESLCLLVVFPAHSNPNNSLLILLQISLLFVCTCSHSLIHPRLIISSVFWLE